MKMKRSLKRIAALMTAVVLTAVMTVPAFAALGSNLLPTDANGTTDTIHNKNTETEEATSFITKNFLMDKGITKTPAETFNYVIEKTYLAAASNIDLTQKDNGDTVPITDEPVITIRQGTGTLNQIVIAEGAASTVVDATSHLASATGTQNLVQATADFKDANGDTLTGSDFPHAGEYVYTITETADSSNTAVKYSTAKYQVHIFVANIATKDTDYNGIKDANGADGLYIAAISAARMTTTDDYNATETGATVTKVNTTTGNGYNGTGNALDFQNMYVKYSKLKLAKRVSGAYADQSKYFTFNAKIDLPATGVIRNAAGEIVTTQYKAYVYDANGKVAAANNNGNAVEYTFENGTAQDVLLKHGQYLLFENADKTPNLPVGTTYTAKETGVTDYIPSASVTYSKVSATGTQDDTDKTAALGNTSATKGGDLTVIEYTEAGYAASPKTVDHTLVGEGLGNATEFLNTFKSVTPTGIIIDNMPYILMILLAGAGLFFILAGKRRRKEDGQ